MNASLTQSLSPQFAVFAGKINTVDSGATEFYGDYLDCSSSPLFPFGHGLSYTSFEYGELRTTAGSTATETSVAVEVRNVGERAGEEVVQLYCRDDVASVARPSRELIGFTRVDLAPGESTTVVFTVPASRLAFYDPAMRRVTEPGTFTFSIGASSADIRTEATVELTGETVLHSLADREMTSVR